MEGPKGPSSVYVGLTRQNPPESALRACTRFGSSPSPMTLKPLDRPRIGGYKLDSAAVGFEPSESAVLLKALASEPWLTYTVGNPPMRIADLLTLGATGDTDEDLGPADAHAHRPVC